MKSLLLRTHNGDMIAKVGLATCLILVLVLLPPAGVTAASPDGWATQTSGTTWTLYGIWGSSYTDILAVGEAGTILHYNGISWDNMSSGVPQALYAVWGSSALDVFAVGQNGVICHYDGTGWSENYSVTNKHLHGVWGTGSDNVYAVGNGGTILNYDGVSWVEMTSNTTTHLRAIWGTSPSDIFAVGNSGLIMHYDGGTWSPQLEGTHPNFNAVWGTASDNVFALGDGGTILRYDGASWDTMTSGVGNDLNGIWGVSSTDIFAVGAGGRVLHYDGNVGNVWSVMDSGVTGDLWSIWGFSSVDVFASGQNGTILYYKERLPDVIAVTPNQGNQGQTLDVAITGSNLDTATSVSFGSGVSVNSYHIDSPTQVTANITIGGAASTGDRDVSVTTLSGTDTLNSGFTVPPASISGVSPSGGDQGQTLVITVSGNNLGGATGVAMGSGVTVNGFTVQDPTRVVVSITIDTGATSGARDVSVTTPESTAALPGGFWVGTHLPAIASVSPSTGRQGEALDVTILGVNLGGTTGIGFGDGVTVNSFAVQSPASVTASITIDISASIGARNVTVTTADGSDILPDGFSVAAQCPTITSVTPSSGDQGETLDVTIVGVNLGGTTGVDFGDGIAVSSFAVQSPTSVTASVTIYVSASVGTRNVTITTADGSYVLPDGFSVTAPAPTIADVSPLSGRLGQTLSVTITGANLGNPTSIDFGTGIAIEGFEVSAPDQMTVTIIISGDASLGTQRRLRCYSRWGIYASRRVHRVSVAAGGSTGLANLWRTRSDPGCCHHRRESDRDRLGEFWTRDYSQQLPDRQRYADNGQYHH